MAASRNRPVVIIGLAICLLALVLGACNMPRRGAPDQSGVNALYTQAAQTVQAQLTQVNQPPATAIDGQTPVPPATQVSPGPEETTAPQPTPAPGETTTPAGTACDRARFVEDVTYPDNTDVAPGMTFVKTWRLQNAGSCTWTSAYTLVFEGGEAMNAPSSLPITTGTVAPQETVDVSVTLVAPSTPGTYRADFKLSNAAGQRFGTGSDGTRPIWALIDVAVESGLVFDFIVQASSARWTSAVENVPGTSLAYGGANDDPSGVAKIVEGVTLETGATSGKVLLMFPRRENSGLVSGLFPAYTVQPGDRLRARLGFMLPEGTCHSGEVIFEIYYREGDAVHGVGSWEKSCDRRLLPIDVDLSDLGGKSVQFILQVRADGSFQDDWAIWNSPRIEH